MIDRLTTCLANRIAAYDDLSNAFGMFGNPLRSADEAGNSPTPDEVVIYFLTGEFREVERQVAFEKLAQTYFKDFANRVITTVKRSNCNRYGQLPL